MTRLLALLALAVLFVPARAERPNVVVILADDLGYGDVAALNPDSTIPTPHLDRLAAAGVRFTDAHSPSAVCTPTRYGLLTGRYCWRTRLTSGVLFPPNDAPLIEPERRTIAGLLADNGYHTACVGKWHLGIEWARDAAGEVDFDKPFGYGPTDVGFNEFFGIAASLDMVPYSFYDGREPVGAVTQRQEALSFPRFVREGPRSDRFDPGEALDALAARAVRVIERQAAEPNPYFLYFALTAPHKPVWPAERFVGTTRLGPHGDFIAHTDWAVGQVLDALDRTGTADETLVVFTSDNGSFMYRREESPDHTEDPSVQAYRSENHRANGPYRGTKADIWEGGHRVPLLVRWPDRIGEPREATPTVCHTDVLATVMDAVGAPTPAGAAEDSYSFLPLLTGESDRFDRPAVVHHSGSGMFAIRQGRWKLVLGDGSGGREKPSGKPFREPFQLFDLQADPTESTDRAAGHPDVVDALAATLERFRTEGRSVPRR